jgi:hypothetical protein
MQLIQKVSDLEAAAALAEKKYEAAKDEVRRVRGGDALNTNKKGNQQRNYTGNQILFMQGSVPHVVPHMSWVPCHVHQRFDSE